jgi:hypothetical protein
MILRLLRCQAWSIAAAGLVLAAFVASLRSMPRHVFWSPDEGGKFYQLASLRWDGGLQYALPYPGSALDPEHRFFPRGPNPRVATLPYPVAATDGTVRFHWPPWFALASRLMADRFGIDGLYVLPLLSGWLIAIVSGWIAHGVAPRLAAPTILIVGLATPVWFYSLTFWEHTVAACAGLLAVALLVGDRRGLLRGLAIVVLLGLAVLLRLEMALLAVAVAGVWAAAAWAARRQRRAPDADPHAPATSRRVWLTVALVAATLGALAFVFASQLPGRHAAMLALIPGRVIGSVQKLPTVPWSLVSVFVETARDEAPLTPTSWAWAVLIAIACCSLAACVASTRLEAALILPGLVGMLAFGLDRASVAQPYRALHGLFPVAPFTVLWLYSLAPARSNARLRRLASVTVLYVALAYVVIFLFRTNRFGGIVNGLEWGPRYLLVAYPLLAILSIAAVDHYRRSARPPWLRVSVSALAAMLIVVGFQLEMRGLAMLRANRQVLASWNDALRSEDAVVTDVWWLSAALAPLSVSKPFYFVGQRDEVADWTAATGATRFTFAATGPVADEELGVGGLRRSAAGSRTIHGLHLVRFEPRQPLEGGAPSPPADGGAGR